MKMISFRPKKKQSPNTIITLPTGAACEFRDGKFTTDDPATAGWLKALGYDEWKPPRKKKPAAPGKGKDDASD